MLKKMKIGLLAVSLLAVGSQSFGMLKAINYVTNDWLEIGPSANKTLEFIQNEIDNWPEDGTTKQEYLNQKNIKGILNLSNKQPTETIEGPTPDGIFNAVVQNTNKISTVVFAKNGSVGINMAPNVTTTFKLRHRKYLRTAKRAATVLVPVAGYFGYRYLKNRYFKK